MHLHAVVIMPEHVHLLLTPMRNAEGWPFPLKNILKLIEEYEWLWVEGG